MLFLVKLVQSQTLYSDAFFYWLSLPIVREGSFEALFKDTQRDPSNSCWNSFIDMREYYKKLPDFDYLFRPTTFFLVVKLYSEWETLIFSFYWRCNLDKVNLDMA